MATTDQEGESSMGIKERLTDMARNLGLFDQPVPAIPVTAITVHAGRLADRVASSGGDTNAWSRFRLVDVDGSQPRAMGDQWPLITSVSYLAKGEGDQPTVYIMSEDDPHGTFPVEPDRPVTIVPPSGDDDIVL